MQKTGDILLPVATFGYSQNKQWYDSTTSTYYAIPDGLSFEATPTTCFTENMVTLQNSTAVWNFISHSAGGYIGLAIDDFGISLNFAQEVQKFQVRACAVVLARALRRTATSRRQACASHSQTTSRTP